jgi:hypothetical protein
LVLLSVTKKEKNVKKVGKNNREGVIVRVRQQLDT